MKNKTMAAYGFRILCILLLTVWVNCDNHDGHEHHETEIDPFEEIKEMYNITTNTIEIADLQRILDEFSTKIHCEGHVDDVCNSSVCFNAQELASIYNANLTGVTEEIYGDMSILLLHEASKVNTTCGEVLSIMAGDDDTAYANILDQFSAESAGLDVEAIQLFLESLSLEANEDHHAEGEDPHHHGEEENHENHGHHEGEEEEHGVELIKEKCLGADILLDQLGLSLEMPINTTEIGHLSGLIVLHILKGSSVSSKCRLFPRDTFFLENIFERFNAVNDMITKEDFKEIQEILSVGSVGHGDHHAGESEDGHNHKRRKRHAHEMEEMFHDHSWESTCYTADQYFAIFDVEGNITKEKFSEMCGALVQQQISGACKTADTHSDDSDEPTVSEKYGYGTIVTVAICLCSVFAVFSFNCRESKQYQYFLELFVGLAIGTLFTDALFHLIPVAFGIHNHGAHDHDHDDGTITVEPYLWHALSVSGGLYLFYLIEKMFIVFRPRSQSEPELKYVTNGTFDKKDASTKVSNPDSLNESAYDEFGSHAGIMGKKKALSGMVVMVIVGDAIHNLADGLALGAAFSSSNSLGFSTAIAIFCHELPHELGDFAVLLNGGLTFCKALFWNLISSLTALLGLYIGLLVSTDESVRQWIVGVTAGLFLYIALVDLLPTLLSPNQKFSLISFILNNVGMLVGAGLMLLLSIFEEKINLS